jgi:hypothetical protein
MSLVSFVPSIIAAINSHRESLDIVIGGLCTLVNLSIPTSAKVSRTTNSTDSKQLALSRHSTKSVCKRPIVCLWCQVAMLSAASCVGVTMHSYQSNAEVVKLGIVFLINISMAEANAVRGWYHHTLVRTMAIAERWEVSMFLSSAWIGQVPLMALVPTLIATVDRHTELLEVAMGGLRILIYVSKAISTHVRKLKKAFYVSAGLGHCILCGSFGTLHGRRDCCKQPREFSLSWSIASQTPGLLVAVLNS